MASCKEKDVVKIQTLQDVNCSSLVFNPFVLGDGAI